MLTFYLCFLAGGTVFPLINFIFGFLGDGADTDVDTDIGADGGFDIHPDLNVDSGTGADIGAGTHTDIDLGAGTHSDTTLGAGLHHGADHGVGVHHGTDHSAGAHHGTDIGADGMGSWISIGLLPTSLLALATLAIVFGAVGSSMTVTGCGKIITLIVSAVAGYSASVVVQSIIKSLKKLQVQNYGINENELMLYDGKVIDTILPGQMGTVSFVTLNEIRVSYPARCADKNIRLETGRIVTVKEVKDGIYIVEPKNKYE